jgi:hypothetical protein
MSPMKENIHDKLKKRKLTLGLYKSACGSGGNEKTLEVFSSTASRTLLF